MYQNQLVAAIKVGGRILREQDGAVLLPFGSEYSVYVKNLNAVRVQVKVSIDGTDATSGTWLVVAPNSAIELERFIRNGNWNEGNRFKFIERSEAIEAHRGIKADDGLIRVEYQTERVRPVVDVPIIREHYYDEWYPNPYPRPRFYGNAVRAASAKTTQSRGLVASCSAGASAERDTGITVPGSLSHQQFISASSFETTGQTDVLILQLRGVVKGKQIVAPVTVASKRTCETCGKRSKTGEFCGRCGTALCVA